MKMTILDAATTETLGWVCIHFIWQASLIWLAMQAALYFLRKRPCEALYIVACVSLTLVALCPVATYSLLVGEFDDPGRLATPTAWEKTSDLFSNVPLQLVPAMSRWLEPSDRIARELDPIFPALIWCWSVGAVAFFIRSCGGSILLRRLLNRTASPLRREWRHLRRLRRRLGIRRRIRFHETSLVDVPATVGWLRPIVLLPASALSGLTISQLQALVAHELAHIRRFDYLVNALQIMVETVLFYHPAVWSISRTIRNEREHCCDHAAAVATGSSVEYAEALIALDELRGTQTHFALSSGGGVLSTRIGRLVFDSQNSLTRSRGAVAGGTILFAALLILIGSRTLGAAIRPMRGLANVQPLTEAVYGILGVPITNETIIPTLVRCAVARTDENLAALSVALNQGNQPSELTAMVLKASNVSSPPAATIHGGVTSGFVEREIVHALHERATRLLQTDRAAARLHARAALLLAAQQSPFFGTGTLGGLLNEATLVNAAELTHRAEARLRRHVDDHAKLSTICALHELRAQKSLAADGDVINEVLSTLDVMAAIAKSRPDIQWKTANLAMSLQMKVPGSRAALLERSHTWSKAIQSPEFDRWMAEASSLEIANPVNRVARPISSFEVRLVSPHASSRAGNAR